MSGAENFPNQNESSTNAVTALDKALEGVLPSTARADYLDFRRLIPGLPYLSEFYIEELLREGLKESPKEPLMWRIIEAALDKISGIDRPNYTIQIARPINVSGREKRAKINESMASTELVIRETRYDGQVTIDGITYQFEPGKPVFSVRKYVYVDYASNVGPTLNYEFAPSSGYLAQMVAAEDGRIKDELVEDSDGDYHLSVIKEVAERFIE